MQNAVTIAAVLGPVLVIMGVSMLLHAKAWHALMEKWEHDHYQFFTMMTFELVIGLLMVRMYNVWQWNVWLIVTVVGWAALIKGALYFLLPGSAVKAMMAWKKGMTMNYIGGIVAVVAGGALSYYTYMM